MKLNFDITVLILSEMLTRSLSMSMSLKGSKSASMTFTSMKSRRSFLSNGPTAALAGVLSSSLLLPQAEQSNAISEEGLIDVYFGCGCFWHVQHEFVEAEKKLLGRSETEITARAGYAGGKAGMLNNKVCYHNAMKISDYGSLGHAEVVNLKIPPSQFQNIVVEYCKLFDDKGYRPDQMGDVGPEYRNLVGIPGGLNNDMAKQMVETSIVNGDKLDFAKGNGDDSDRRALVWIMDTDKYPFYIAEQYHQFHDGFNFGENYPNSYNNLASKFQTQGKLEKSDCPNGLIGVGALGL